MNISPDRASLLSIDPQLAAATKLTRELSAEFGPPPANIHETRERQRQLRAWWNRGGPAMAEIVTADVEGPFRPIPIVIYRASRQATAQPAFVYLHGGGYKLGDQWANDRQMRELAQAWGGIVISADYLHAPEHLFPLAIEEIAALLQWLSVNGGQWGVDGTRLAFGGSSAGANIALGAALHLGGTACSYLRAGALVVGSFGDSTVTESMMLYDRPDLYPTKANVIAAARDYIHPAQMEDPRFNPLLANPAAIPPLFIAGAEFDVLRDSSRALATRLQTNNRPVVFKEYPGMTHLFLGFSRIVDRALECIDDIAAFLNVQLKPR